MMDNNDNNRCPQQRAFSYLALNAKNVKKNTVVDMIIMMKEQH